MWGIVIGKQTSDIQRVKRAWFETGVGWVSTRFDERLRVLSAGWRGVVVLWGRSVTTNSEGGVADAGCCSLVSCW